MPKRLVLCCDGTWNTADQERDGRPCPTNVTKVALAVDDRGEDGVEQRVYYQRGVGTKPGERLRGGAFGVGLSRNVQDAYRFVVEHYDPGDELFFLGFSRGAYTARSTVGLIRNCGVLRREHAGRLKEAHTLYRSRAVRPRDLESQLFRRSYSHEPRIRFLGVWDTVGSLGIPSVGLGLSRIANRRLEFHDTRLSSTVDAAYQALAVDERRRPFAPTLWDRRSVAGRAQVEQVWFTGDHCDVGGGHRESELADIALLWMVDRARSCGLGFRDDAFRRSGDGGPAAYDGRTFPVDPDPLGRLHDSRRWAFRLLRPHSRAIGQEDPSSESVAASAVRRHELLGEEYAPRGLLAYLAGSPRVTDVPGSGTRQEEPALTR
ncbi:uncharacterized protein (DUF2235 family) [Geodermatophilus bullaregiensis]|uniref:DUF2235 domain-containing protein n=1 Tax=Geodermatophilus bullaregiensis TaxID=1564160 RepID=UPI001956F415|nr:DUF2235 domain-containing protein [Geodermatophilus bullaregiensis]MBM7809042.1 uncharacterized protein (DUF2235 family) [Geodermatophilus bullaregiensis]